MQTNTLLDQSGLIHLFGQIKNISNESQKDVVIYATFYDKHGKYIGNASGIASVRSINPGQVSPFEIIFLDKDKSKLFSEYVLNLTSKIGIQKPESMVIGSSKSRPDIFGYYYVSGRILNTGGEAATNVLAIASFFDDKGKIIGLSSAIAEPSNMTSNDIASFTIVMDDKLQSSKIKNYSLTIDSDQYVSK
ncbi:MAG TPA: FxLYD domain-containing protein [Nitrososphaeraceae archaeon]